MLPMTRFRPTRKSEAFMGWDAIDLELKFNAFGAADFYLQRAAPPSLTKLPVDGFPFLGRHPSGFHIRGRSSDFV